MKLTKPILCLSAVVLSAAAGEPSLTIYNQNFAVVRETVPFDLQTGVNSVHFDGATAHVEPDSVILRDADGKQSLQILEQNYRNDAVSQGLLLSMFEGKTIDFETVRTDNGQQKREIVQGKIIRSGYVPHTTAFSRYGQPYYQQQMAYAATSEQPIIEVNGQLRFSLPGEPLFPSLGDDAILKPTLEWKLQSDKAGKVDAEVGYVTGGFTWQADYNLVSPEKSDTVDLIGWVTMDNQSGKTFQNAKIKLMAGDVQKLQPQNGGMYQYAMEGVSFAQRAVQVTEKAFDEFHLYTLERPTTLQDRETKQVEFVRAAGVKAPVVYVYDGVKWDNYRGWNYQMMRENREYGTESNTKVWVMREFLNSEANHLGMALPKGKLRFYRQDADGQLEFTGEDTIDHTPRDEKVRVFTGNAFDLVGGRRQTDFKVDSNRNWADESFEIKLRNRKKEPVEIRVVEHLYRWNNWQISQESDPHLKTDAQTMEFMVQVKPDEEKTVSYTVHYSW